MCAPNGPIQLRAGIELETGAETLNEGSSGEYESRLRASRMARLKPTKPISSLRRLLSVGVMKRTLSPLPHLLSTWNSGERNPIDLNRQGKLLDCWPCLRTARKTRLAEPVKPVGNDEFVAGKVSRETCVAGRRHNKPRNHGLRAGADSRGPMGGTRVTREL